MSLYEESVQFRARTQKKILRAGLSQDGARLVGMQDENGMSAHAVRRIN
jgi:hypothetical protein